MGVANNFSADYAEAREKFRQICHKKGIATVAYRNPTPGPDGLELTTDVAYLGAPDAKNLLILISGTHGLEGLAGSGCQIGWILSENAEALAKDTGALIIHQLNPWGVAWARRQTEDNVDLNRNFMDFAQPLPHNEHYSALKSALNCAEWAGPRRDAANAEIADFRKARGEVAFASAIMQGQYEDPKGIGFAGRAPTWANRTFYKILEKYTKAAKRVALIDFHTGLGPYGYGMLINTSRKGTKSLELAQAWYGNSLICLRSGTGNFPYEVVGDLCTALENIFAPAEVISCALEFGTFEPERLFGLMIQDCWLENHGDLASERGRQIRTDLLAFFYPATKDWFEMIDFRARQVIGQAVAGLSA